MTPSDADTPPLTCPTCGTPVEVVGSDEGTNYYRSLDATRAAPPSEHVHEGEWCRACLSHGAETMLAGIAEAESVRAALDTTRAAEPGLRRLVVRAHRHLVMRGAPEKGEATYLALMDDLLDAVGEIGADRLAALSQPEALTAALIEDADRDRVLVAEWDATLPELEPEPPATASIDVERLALALHKTRGSNDDYEYDMVGAHNRAVRVAAEYARLSSAKDPAPEGEPTVCAVCGISLPDDAAAVEHLGTALANERIRGAHRATR